VSSKLAIVNTALARIGHSTLSSFDSDLGRRLELIYDSVLRAKLASYPWKFATREIVLTSRTPTDGDIDSYFPNHYLLPDNVLGPLGFIDEYEYEIRGQTISSRAIPTQIGQDEITCEPIYENPRFLAVVEITEGYFSEPFRLALEYQLAAEFSITVTEDESKAQGWTRLAQMEWRRARVKDSQSATSKNVERAIDRYLARSGAPLQRY
jgi:hypothetical protein